jgi:polyphosphate kinase 2
MEEKIIQELRTSGEKGFEALLDTFKKRQLAPSKILKSITLGPKRDIISSHYPYEQKMGRSDYEKQKKKLQIEFVKLQKWIKVNDHKVVTLFEGRDAAGKGGTIKRMMEHLNPRGARTVALEKPSEEESGQWYFQRYTKYLPTNGEMVFFDRSWYNRAGVERVMGFCDDQQYDTFIVQVSEYERMLITSGVVFTKFWFSVSQEEQLRRFMSRILDPLKQWKISPMDIASLNRWSEYTEAKESMFRTTDTAHAPWTVIRSDCKKRARLNAMRFILSKFSYDRKDDSAIGVLDERIIGAASDIYEPDEMLHRENFKRSKKKR